MGDNNTRYDGTAKRDATVGRRPFLRAVAGASVVGVTGLAGCSGDGGDGGGGDGGSGDGSSGGNTDLTFGGSTNTSSSFQAAIPWAEQLGQHAEPSMEISVQSTGGLDANVRQVSAGQFDLASTTTPNFQAAAIGETPFQEEHTGLRPLFTNQVYPFPIGLTTTDTGVDYLEDLTGKAVATGQPGSSTHTYFSLYAGVNEIDMGEIDTRRVGPGDAYRQLGEGQIDAVVTGSVNTVLGPSTQEFIQRNDDAKLVVPRDPDRTDRLARAGEILGLGYERGGVMFDFPLETFQHAHENSAVADQDSYTTVAGTNTLFASDAMSDEIAREITRLTIERSQQLADATALWQGFHDRTDYFATALPAADSAAQPWHPGAAEALREAGVWNDDHTVADE